MNWGPIKSGTVISFVGMDRRFYLATFCIGEIVGCANYGGYGAGSSVAVLSDGGGGGHPVVHQPLLPPVRLFVH